MKIFDTPILQEKIEDLKHNPPKYVMGIDFSDNNQSAYCLIMMDTLGVRLPEVILSKKGRTDAEFRQEAENLAKYFNADIKEQK